jgi:formamidopyrimidine-DNA glycosylase
MPELPEVEYAASLARRIAVGRTITSVALLHRSLRRTMPRRVVRSLVGDGIDHIERRGKTQLFRLRSGRVLSVHFRMTGDWLAQATSDPLPPHARALLDFDNGARLVLDDPRALAVLTLHRSGERLVTGLGPEPTDSAFTGHALRQALASRRGAIKPVLLDQRVVAGLGNIYVSESLWRSRIDPRTVAHRLSASRADRLVDSIRWIIERAIGTTQRYYGGETSSFDRFDVYDREGERCRRCKSRIRRIVQAGRSTYFCPRCQR